MTNSAAAPAPPAVRALALGLLEEEMSARRFTERYRAVIRASVRAFLRWSSRRGSGDPRAVSKKDLCAYFAFLNRETSKRSGEPLSPGVVNGRFAAVTLLYAVLYRAELVTENPCHALDLVRRRAIYHRRPLTRDEIGRFLESLDTANKRGRRDRALFELIYSSGLRVSEAACLKVADIDFGRRLMIVRGKLDRDRMVPVSRVAADFLTLYLGARIDCPDSWVFPGSDGHLTGQHISDLFRDLLRGLGMDAPDISAHSIRHSTATHLLENGASIRHVQELLGHVSIESTVRYTHLMVDNLAKVYRRHHPRERELFEAVDDDYRRRLGTLLAGNRKPG